MGRPSRGPGDGRHERGLAAYGVEPPPRPAASVTEVVAVAKRALDGTPALQDVLVRGEVSGFKAYGSSGHWYFNLKDEHSQLRAAMFRGHNARVRFTPEDGMSVVARGNVGVYVPRGEMNFVVSHIEPEGVGALAVAFEQLKLRLLEEGLFGEERKRPLPFLPLVVGVVTSLQGAVWHDIQKVARRRHPGIRLVIRPVKVQGEGAAREVADAIALFNRHRAADVLIVGRGGGSPEDLWAFNEEETVRAIAASRIPVVSAVGHETDVTLADLVADVRAATPSQAAELVVPEFDAVLQTIADAEARLRHALGRRADNARAVFEGLARATVLVRPDVWLAEHRQRVDEATGQLAPSAARVVEAKRAALGERAASLHALSPLAVLARGYGTVRRASDGRAVRSAGDVALDDLLDVLLVDGNVEARVTRVTREDRRTPEGESE